MKKQPYYITAHALAEAGRKHIPSDLISGKHLIYSSPATLAFNSPGAQGFGVKRAGLAIPGSVMLLVAPGCCGRNTTILSQLGGYSDRFFYLLMDQNDIVTGKHLKSIPQAVYEICQSLTKKPTSVMICITCVDALLGTDMERVCRKASAQTGLPVLPCYMYALTREGRKPPMVAVRQSLYSLLRPQKKHADVVNLLGYFAPFMEDCELYTLLHQAGLRTIHELSRCQSFEEYRTMSQANFNLVLNPEARLAADEMEKKLGIPAIELTRMYQLDKIQRQYQIFAHTLDTTFEDADFHQAAEKAIQSFIAKHPNITAAIGSVLNANSFELALALTRYGLHIAEIYSDPAEEDFFYIRRLSELSPDTRIYTNTSPSMLYYEPPAVPIQLTIGKDAGYYHPECANVSWNEEQQPFGYQGLRLLFEQMDQSLAQVRRTQTYRSATAFQMETPAAALHFRPPGEQTPVRGLRLALSPFAPDQSGAAAVFYGLGGLMVICDAGGCAGNICGFDEPRWFDSRSAIFSAGLRDMDAILGRDDKLVDKLCTANEQIQADFAVVIGTPVPAVIATDYKALRHMTENRLQIPVLTVATDGTALYDAGEQKAWLELFSVLSLDTPVKKEKTIGVLGITPLDTGTLKAPERLRLLLHQEGWQQIYCYGADGDLSAVRNAGGVSQNLVLSPAALPAARYLKKRFGTPFTIDYPLAEAELSAALDGQLPSGQWKNVLILHQQTAANAMRKILRHKLPQAHITVASWFMLQEDQKEPQDLAFSEELQFRQQIAIGGYDCILGDALFQRAIPDFTGAFIDLPHFAVSGKLWDASKGKRGQYGIYSPEH